MLLADACAYNEADVKARALPRPPTAGHYLIETVSTSMATEGDRPVGGSMVKGSKEQESNENMQRWEGVGEKKMQQRASVQCAAWYMIGQQLGARRAASTRWMSSRPRSKQQAWAGVGRGSRQSSPRSRRASCMSFTKMVTRLAWMAHIWASSNRPTRYASAASCSAVTPATLHRLSPEPTEPSTSRASRQKGARAISFCVANLPIRWYWRISLQAHGQRLEVGRRRAMAGGGASTERNARQGGRTEWGPALWLPAPSLAVRVLPLPASQQATHLSASSPGR